MRRLLLLQTLLGLLILLCGGCAQNDCMPAAVHVFSLIPAADHPRLGIATIERGGHLGQHAFVSWQFAGRLWAYDRSQGSGIVCLCRPDDATAIAGAFLPPTLRVVHAHWLQSL